MRKLKNRIIFVYMKAELNGAGIACRDSETPGRAEVSGRYQRPRRRIPGLWEPRVDPGPEGRPQA